MKYIYRMRLRRFSPSCQPMDGLVGVEGGDEQYHNLLFYDRELTEEGIEDYELDFIGKMKGVIKMEDKAIRILDLIDNYVNTDSLSLEDREELIGWIVEILEEYNREVVLNTMDRLKEC